MGGRPKRTSLGLGGALIGLAFCMIAIDFFAFCGRVTEAHITPPPPDIDGVVALTGGSGKRMAAGVSLLMGGTGKRLLISGVNEAVTRTEIIGIAGGDEDIWTCCIDLGHEARTTTGNARETAKWAARHQYQRLLIVTSDYHMPRSLIELRRTMPERTLLAYPVRTKLDPRAAWRDPATFRQMASEWAKWRVTQIRRGWT